MRWAGNVARITEKINRILVGRRGREERRPFRKPGCRWGDNIKMDIKELACDSMYWINVAEDIVRHPCDSDIET